MKKLFNALILLLSLNIYSQSGKEIYSLPDGFANFSEEEQNSYIVTKLEDIIKEQILFFDTSFGEYNLNKWGTLISVYCISDSILYQLNEKRMILFEENLIYQFSTRRYMYLYNNILVIKNNEMHIFKALNCPSFSFVTNDLILFLLENGHTDEEASIILLKINDFKNTFKYMRKCNYERIKCF